MTQLVVHTARVSYGGPDRLDVTAKSAERHGKPFAPSWALVKWGLSQRAAHNRKLATRDRDADSFWQWTWKLYEMRYVEQMRVSYVYERWAWDALLRRQHVVLVCYCTDVEHCHRRLLAEILVKLGATYQGEVDT
jgi:uncharacterized protein YeaO (DUF488 family)